MKLKHMYVRRRYCDKFHDGYSICRYVAGEKSKSKNSNVINIMLINVLAKLIRLS